MPPTGASDRFSINAQLIRETDKAWLIDDGDKRDWIPKSQAEIYKCADGTYDVFCEEWLLKKKGFV